MPCDDWEANNNTKLKSQKNITDLAENKKSEQIFQLEDCVREKLSPTVA